MQHPDDGKFVVVQNGRRISDLQPDEQAAIQEAQRLRKAALKEGQEAKNAPQAPIEVKQNLLG